MTMKAVCQGDIRLKVAEKLWTSPDRKFPKKYRSGNEDENEEDEEEEDEEEAADETGMKKKRKERNRKKINKQEDGNDDELKLVKKLKKLES